jgi:hypothetical protein
MGLVNRLRYTTDPDTQFTESERIEFINDAEVDLYWAVIASYRYRL